MKKKTKQETKNIIFIIILAIVGLVLFFRVTSFGFVWDDNPLYLNKTNYPETSSFQNIGKFWSPGKMPMYAPVTYTTWSIITSISANDITNTFGKNPFLFHLANVLIHILNSIILLLILYNLFKYKLAAFAASLIFLIHPLNVESVVWISELRGLLSCLFGLLAILYFLNSKSKTNTEDTTDLKTIFIISLLMILSFLSKPSGIVFPVILILIDFFHFKSPLKNNLKLYISLVIITIAFALVSVAGETQASKFIDVPVSTRYILPLFSYIFYLIKVILPINLTAVYGLTPQYLSSNSIFLIYSAIFFLLTLTLIIFRKKSKYIAAGMIISFFALLPTSGIIPFYYQTFSTVADRYFYIAMIGISIIISVLFSNIEKINTKYTILALVSIILFYLSYTQQPRWQNEFSHWNNVINGSSIAIPQAFMGRGEANIKLGNQAGAIDDFTSSIKLKNTEPLYYYNRGNAYLDLNQYTKAISDFSESIKLRNDFIDAYVNRGMAYSELSDRKSAMSDFQKAISLEPKQTDALNYIGVLYAQSDNLDSAIYYFQRALSVNPNDIQATENLQKATNELMKLKQ